MAFFRVNPRGAETEEKTPKKKGREVAPIPWLAAFLSILMPGLGHVYSHRWFRGILFFLFSTGFTVLGIISTWAGFAGMTFLSTVGTVFYLLGIVDAYRCSKKAVEEISILPSDRWSVILFSLAIVVFIVSFSVVVGGTVAVKYIGHPVSVETKSMVPTLRNEERVLANIQVSRAYCFRQGDLVAVFIPGYKRVEEVRRVIALPGQKVAMMAGIVQVNGRPLKEDYVSYQENPFSYKPDDRAVYFPELIVPDGRLFLMSDLRDAGEDSREWGPVDESRFIGRVDFLFYPLERRRQFADSYLALMTRKLMGFIPGINNRNGGHYNGERNLKKDGD